MNNFRNIFFKILVYNVTVGFIYPNITFKKSKITVSKYQLTNLDFQNLIIKDSASIEIRINDNCFIEYNKELNYNIAVKNNTLYIENLNIDHKCKRPILVVHVNKNTLKNIYIDNKVGDIDIKNENIDNIDIKNNVGNINVVVNNTKNAYLKTTVGNISFNGTLNLLKINGDVSDVDCKIHEKIDDYRISVNKTVGEQNIKNKLIGNKLIDIDITVGKVNINFQ